METTLYNSKGEKKGTIAVPENLFGLQWNADLVHQVVTSMQDNARMGNAHTKDRGEVRGGGKKPWAQKGTGRARHGSSRSPIWKGGGVAHGPRNEKIFARKINQKMRQKALLVTLSRKMKDGEIIFVDTLEMTTPRARDAKVILSALSRDFVGFTKSKNAAFIALPTAHTPTQKSFQNFGNVVVDEVRNLNPLNILKAKYLVIANPEVAFATLSKKSVVKSAAVVATK